MAGNTVIPYGIMSCVAVRLFANLQTPFIYLLAYVLTYLGLRLALLESELGLLGLELGLVYGCLELSYG